MLRRTAKGTAVAVVVLLLVLLVHRKTLFVDVDHLTYDYTVDTVGLSAPTPDIVLVDFDEATFQRIGVYPVPRTYFAQALQRVTAGSPKVVALDLFLDEPRTPAEDKALADAIKASGVVILASQGPTATLPAVMPLKQFCQPEQPDLSSGFCIEGSGALGYAFVEMPIDPDGFIRQANLFSDAGKSVSFPLTLAQQLTGEAIQPAGRGAALFHGHRVPYANRDIDSMLIGSWGREPALRLSAWKVLDGQVPPSTFTNRLVMIGQTSSAARDTDFTPLFREAGPDGVRLSMGGTAIHAAAVRTLLEGRAVYELPRLWLYALVLVLCSAAATLLLSCDLRIGLSSLAVFLLVMGATTLLLFAKFRVWLPLLPVEGSLALTLPLTMGLRFVEERFSARDHLQQREQLMSLFSSYVDPAVAETIWTRRSELSLGGEEHTATVMFTDVRNFTALSSNQAPAVVLAWLNRYVIAMDEVIRQHGGFLNKFIGDGLMIIFGLPISHGVRRDARQAVNAALAMLARVEELNAERPNDPEFPELHIGIGVHTGSLVAGSIGSASRQEYSVIGETVNLASRLESLNKNFSTELLLSEGTVQHVETDFPGIEYLGESPVKGLQEPIKLYTLRAAGKVAAAEKIGATE